MDRDQVAAILAEIGTLLELQGETGFRTNAYHNGARAVQQLEEDLGDVIRQGRLGDVPGIGATLREKITTLVTTGGLPFYDKLNQNSLSAARLWMDSRHRNRETPVVFQEIAFRTRASHSKKFVSNAFKIWLFRLVDWSASHGGDSDFWQSGLP